MSAAGSAPAASGASAAAAAAATTVFVRHLPYSWTDRDLERAFEHIAPIKRAFVVTTRGTKRSASAMLSEDGGVQTPGAGAGAGESRGFGFIEFSLPTDAQRAVAEMNGRDVTPADAAAKAAKGPKAKPLAVELSVKKGEKPAAAAPKKVAAAGTPAPAAAAATPAVKSEAPAKPAAAAAAASPKAAPTPAPAAAAAKPKKGLSVKDVKLDATVVQKAKEAAKQEAAKAAAQDSETSDDEEEGEKPAKRQKTAAAPEAKPAKAVPAAAAAAKPSSTSASSDSVNHSRTLLLSGINPTVKSIREHLVGLTDSIETLLYPSPESTLKYKAARVLFKTDALAMAAEKMLDKKLIKGDPIRALRLRDESKSNRVIVRNLPWLVGEKRIHLIFRDCCKPIEEGGGGGRIVGIDLPKEADGKSKGFGFLSFTTLAAAELALKKTGTLLNQRPIAVDWALAKDDYLNRVTLNSALEQKQKLKQQAKDDAAAKEAKAADKTKKVKAENDMEDDDDIKVKEEPDAEGDETAAQLAKDKRKNRSVLDSILAGVGSDSDEDDAKDAKKGKVAATKKSALVKAEDDEDEDMADASDDDEDEEEEEGSEGDDEDEDDEEDEDASEDEHEDDAINMSDDDDDSQAEDDEEEEEEEEEEKEEDPAAARARHLASKPSDTTKGCTVFIRNLAYDTREKDLLDKFTQFGTVKYAKVVWDHALDRSRGTAFVQFEDPAVAKKVVGLSVDTSTTPAALYQKNRITAALKSNQGITLGGRVLNIALAVDRNSASELQERNKVKQAQDKRNLYLANEGNIRADSEAAKAMPPAELEKREKAFREKKKKLKNPNYCVSRTRLSVRNLPLDCDEKVLKRVFLKAARDAIKEQPRDSALRDGTIPQPVVRQVKLLRSTDRLDAKGEGRSKRYGFLEFEEHEHSLLALRRLNNNPDAFKSVEGISGVGRNARPFVEFALEDVRKLLIRTQKLAAAQKRRALREKQQAELDSAAEGDKKAAAAKKALPKSSEQPRKKAPKPVLDPTAGGGRGACFVCGEGGHISKNCPKAAGEGAAEGATGSKRKAPAAEEATGKKQRGASAAAPAPAAAAAAAAAASAAAAPAAASAASAKRNKNNRHRDVAVPRHLRDDEDGQEDRLDALARKHKQQVASGGAEAKRPTLHLGDATLKAAESRWF